MKLSQFLHSKYVDLQIAADHLRSFSYKLSEQRLNFDAMQAEAGSYGLSEMGATLTPTFEQKQKSKYQYQFDSRITDHGECFWINVFYTMLGIVNTQIE